MRKYRRREGGRGGGGEGEEAGGGPEGGGDLNLQKKGDGRLYVPSSSSVSLPAGLGQSSLWNGPASEHHVAGLWIATM